MKKLNRKGFTLAELLIVVAIIGVLVAIAIPVFNSQLAKARVRTDLANIRSAYAEAVVSLLDSDNPSGNPSTVVITNVKLVGRTGDPFPTTAADLPGDLDTVTGWPAPGNNKTLTFTVGSSGKLTSVAIS